ncbi:MAG: GNAT family N-acetyltransferase [Candidatus Heimdallarchaeota archaeon]
MNIKIDRFFPRKASDEMWDKYFTLKEAIYHEGNSKDKLPSRILEKSFMMKPSSDYNIYRLVIFNEENSQVIGYGNLWHENEKSPYYENVKDKTYAYIAIAKDHRRKGLATELLKAMTKYAKSIEKSIIRTEISRESGVSFCKKLEGELITERVLNRLYLNDVDWNLLDSWRKNAKGKKEGVSVEIFEAIPEVDLEEFCKLYTKTWNMAPAEDMICEMIFTPEKRRADEALYRDKDCIWLTIITREPNGEISGLSEVFYNEENPEFLEQELTGVIRDYQGRGLGKWLKAEMLFYLKERFPKAKYIQTGNNNENAPMLSINNRMGFKIHQKQTFFEFDLEKLLTKLGIKSY